MSICPGCKGLKQIGEIFCRKCESVVSGGPMRPASKADKSSEAVEEMFRDLFKIPRSGDKDE